ALQAEPPGRARVVQLFADPRHGKIAVRGRQLVVDLVVDRGVHVVSAHEDSPLRSSSYSASTTDCQRSRIGFRRSLSVGVSSPVAIENSAGSSASFFSRSYCASSEFRPSTTSW